jgi:acyl-CoA reductase-like NAD-dependent aldehyde dehydrogenase
MVDSVLVNSGRGCINCSGVWVSRHAREIAEALAERMGPVQPRPPEDPESALAAFTVKGQADGVSADIDAALKEPGVHDLTARYGPRLVKQERCDYLRPTVILCDGPDKAMAKKEYMFPFVTVVQCPQDKMLANIGPTLVCSAITEDPKFQRALLDATHIDRLNIGPMRTIQLNWLQPHEGSIVDFLFRARAFQHEGMLKV